MAEFSYKLYNDKITMSMYHKPLVQYKYHSPTKKEILMTGERVNWDFSDSIRRRKSFHSSLTRTHKILNELSSKNAFKYFLTITLNKQYVDRASAIAVHNTFKKVIKRLKYKYGDVSYIAVAEYHKDKNIHYHIMINFAIAPKLRYKHHTNKCHAMYYILDEFKKEDCFLVVEKLKTNNLHYLTKYLTKANDFPMHRKFNASRNLNRSRVQDVIRQDIGNSNHYMQHDMTRIEYEKLTRFATERGFNVVFANSKMSTFSVDGTDVRACADVDLSSIDTKGEKNGSLSDFFYNFWIDWCKILQKNRIILQKIENGKEKACRVLSSPIQEKMNFKEIEVIKIG